MKNILTSLYLFVLVASPVFSQEFHPRFSQKTSQYPGASHETFRQDTGFWGNASIKINPLRTLSGFIGGEEYGGIIQVPLLKDSNARGKYYCLDAYIGGGLNEYFGVQSPEGKFPSGYTIRAGFYRFFSDKRRGYISLQYFFRFWSFQNSIDYGGGTNTILAPLGFGGERDSPDYRYNATVNINCYDLVYGNQIYVSSSGRTIIDWYVGLGVRIKNINESVVGNYHNGQYYPNTTPVPYDNETDIYPDVKAGFMIGFTL